jgi:hypothetical protein
MPINSITGDFPVSVDNTDPEAPIISERFTGVLATLTANQALNHRAWTTLSGFTVATDTDSWYDGGSPDRITVPSGIGITYVEVSAGVSFASFNAGPREIRLRKNGSEVFAGNAGSTSQSGTSAINLSICTPPIPVVEGDYFEVQVRQNSGSALNAQSGSSSFIAAQGVSG